MIDWHVHSTFSDGQMAVEELLDSALKLGITSIAITDHWDPYDFSQENRTKTDAELFLHLEHIREEGRKRELEVFAGIETATGSDGKIRLSGKIIESCDIIITSPHYVAYDGPIVVGEYFNDEYWASYKSLVIAQAKNRGDILGHPEGYLPITPMLEAGTTYERRQQIRASISERYLDKPYYETLSDALLCSGKALELHGASLTPREWVVELLAKRGVLFSIGSDAHAVSLLGKNERAAILVERYNLKLFVPHHAG